MAATLEIVQEGSLRVLSGRPKTPSSIYDYRIQANGSLKIGNLHKQHDLTIDLLSYNFVDICEELMIGGFLVKLVKGETDEVLLVFETPLALQTFCFGCYKLCKSEKLKELICELGWASSLDNLRADSNCVVSKRAPRRTFVHVNVEDSPISELVVVGTIDHDSEGYRRGANESHLLAEQFSSVYKRVASHLPKANGAASKELQEQPHEVSVFSSVVHHLRVSPGNEIVLPPLEPAESGTVSFVPGYLEIGGDGSLSLRSLSEIGTWNTLTFTSQKVLCMRCMSPADGGDLISDIQKIAIGVSLFRNSSGYSSTEADGDSNFIADGGDKMGLPVKDNIVFIFPSLSASRGFLTSISKTVSVHNVMGFLIDMSWLVRSEVEEEVGAREENTSSSAAAAKSPLQDIVVKPTPKKRIGSIYKTASMDIVLPAVVIEEEEEEVDDSGSELSNPSTPLGGDSDIKDRTTKGLSSNDSDAAKDSPKKRSTAANIIKRLQSGDSVNSYNELGECHDDDIEAQHKASKPQGRKSSRLSWLFGGVLQKKESNADIAVVQSNEETVLAMLESNPADGFSLPAQSIASTGNGKSRFSFLKNIVQLHEEENGAFNSSEVSVGDLRGIKGVRQQHALSASVASTRSTRIFGEGLGCAVGGVLIDGLIVKPQEFTFRFLEESLKNALPHGLFTRESSTRRLHSHSVTASDRNSDVTMSNCNDLLLILDGANLSREKHVEIIISCLKLTVREAMTMIRSWVLASAGADTPDHWDDFVLENPSAFESRVKARKMELKRGRTPSPGPSGKDTEFAFSSESKDLSMDTSACIGALSLRYCGVTARGVGILVDSLRWNKSLVSLNLCGNCIDTDAAAASLGNMLNFNTHLVELNLQETGLGNTGATMVAQALHVNTSIERLLLSGNHIDPKGCTMLALALEENTTLTHLNLSRNEIGAQGAKVLANALYVNKSLLYLDINRQKLKGKIGASGTKYLAQGLRMNNSLRVFRLARNRIGFEGSRHLSGMLLVNRGLRILDLAYSKIGVEGAMQLGGALHQNNSLQSIVLANRLLPVCFLKGVHDTDYYLRHSRTSMPVDVSITHDSVRIPDAGAHTSGENVDRNDDKTHEELEEPVAYVLEDDVYNATSETSLNCDIIYEGGEKKFDKIDLQVLVVSTICTDEIDVFISECGDQSKSTTQLTNEIPPTSLQSTTVILPLPLSDEESVLIAHLVRTNSLLQELRLENTFLPIQQLRGRSILLGNSIKPVMYALDLSDSNLMSSDAIVVGMLISENPALRTICLKGNYFDKTEGESWIADALSKNSTLCLDTNMWSAEEMFSDGYHQLAALKGVSASGAAIEPQRLDTLSYKIIIVLGGLAYYLDVMSDIYVTYLYASKPDLYRKSWVVWSAIIISLPTFMTLCSIVRTTWMRDVSRALQQMMIVILQLHPMLHVYESVLMGIETTALLDTKYLEGVYENIPQIFLQTYIMFTVSVEHGGFALSIFFSVLISLISVSGVLVMLVDRGKVRKASLGPRERNPWFVRWMARLLAVVLESEMVATGRAQEAMKGLVNYSCFVYSHFFWAMILQFSTLSVRVIALTWLLAVVESYKFVVFILIFVPRMFILAYLDPKSQRRSTFRNTLWCSCYCLISAIWDKDERYPVSSRRAFLCMNTLDTVESFVFISYAGFISTSSRMKFYHGVFTVVAVIFFKLLSWALILSWQLPVHFSELLDMDKSKTFFPRLWSYFFGSDSKALGGGIVTAPPTRNLKHVEDLPRQQVQKTWWSSGARSATMEMSYVSAVLRGKNPFFSAVVSSAADARESEAEEIVGGRDRGVARDWDAMPEAVRQSKGRFTLKGGSKKRYSDDDLYRNIQGRSSPRPSKHGNKFSGWNRQVASSSIRFPDKKMSVGPQDDFEECESGDKVQSMELGRQGRNKKIGLANKDAKRRGTANPQYADFIPTNDDGENLVRQSGEEKESEIFRNQHGDLLWMENPSNAQVSGFRVSDIG